MAGNSTVDMQLLPEEALQRSQKELADIKFALDESAIVRLRHSAPVGHAFGVPSQTELLEAWDRTRRSLMRFAPTLEDDDGFPLPGFTALVSELAGAPMAPDTLLADTASAIRALLEVAATEPA